jgi:Fungal specific transcription factor domain
VHTKPEDREPPKKRGRPPKSSYITNAQKDPSSLPQTASPDTPWRDAEHDCELTPLTSDSNFPFSKPQTDTESGYLLSNPFNDNFGFGPIDTLSEFNFAELDILSFLNPTQSRQSRAPSTFEAPPPNDTKPVVLQPDFVDWLQMNREDYSFSMHNSSPQGLGAATSTPGPDLLEPDESETTLLNPASPNTSITIDEKTYMEILESLRTKVPPSTALLKIASPNVQFHFAQSARARTVYFTFLRLFSSPFSYLSRPDIQRRLHSRFSFAYCPNVVPLLLSICCIGAMYCMEREKARALWERSRRIVDVMIAEECLTPGEYPVWVSQVLFLHCWYAAWLGDNKLLQWALGRRGSLATVHPPECN